MADRGLLHTAFDVGANIGGWTTAALSVAPWASIHAFEIVPATFSKLQTRLRDHPRVQLVPTGLSNRSGDAPLVYYPDHDTVSTLVRGTFGIHDEARQTLTVPTITGDTYCERQRIDKIDYLKIDVEGAEYDVITGFSKTTELKRISVIQFEYGLANIFSRRLLIDFYSLLEGRGFAVGLLTTGGVRFARYRPRMEDFRGPNYVAVLRDRSDIIEAVSA